MEVGVWRAGQGETRFVFSGVWVGGVSACCLVARAAATGWCGLSGEGWAVFFVGAGAWGSLVLSVVRPCVWRALQISPASRHRQKLHVSPPTPFRSDFDPISIRFRSDSRSDSRSDFDPISIRFRSDFDPIPISIRFRSGFDPISIRFRSDFDPISIRSSVGSLAAALNDDRRGQHQGIAQPDDGRLLASMVAFSNLLGDNPDLMYHTRSGTVWQSC